MTLRAATPADFPLVRELAQRPDYAPFITDEDEAGLAAYLAAPDCQFLIWEPEGKPAGFAIFCEIGNPSGRVELMRLALVEAGKGQGDRFLRVLLEHAFRGLGAERVWLDCSGENLRAQKVYGRVGLVQEARLRRHHFVPVLARTVDKLIYGMFRADWLALRRDDVGHG
ncbi:MAG: GNAT family N-acetyltransferase [Tabrizicola sp.]